MGDALSSPLWLAIDQGHCFCDHYTTEGDRLHLQGDDQRPMWESSGSVFLRRIIDMHSHRHTHTHTFTVKQSISMAWGNPSLSSITHVTKRFYVTVETGQGLMNDLQNVSIRCCLNYK